MLLACSPFDGIACEVVYLPGVKTYTCLVVLAL